MKSTIPNNYFLTNISHYNLPDSTKHADGQSETGEILLCPMTNSSLVFRSTSNKIKDVGRLSQDTSRLCNLQNTI